MAELGDIITSKVRVKILELFLSDITEMYHVRGIVREIKEEINADIAPTRLIAIYSTPEFDFTYPNGNKIHPIIFFFECQILNIKNFHPSKEIKEASYFSLDYLPKMLPCCIQKAKDCQLRRKDVIIR